MLMCVFIFIYSYKYMKLLLHILSMINTFFKGFNLLMIPILIFIFLYTGYELYKLYQLAPQ